MRLERKQLLSFGRMECIFLLRGSVRTLPVKAFHLFTFRENIRGQKITPNRLQSQAGRAVCGGHVSSSCVC